MFQHMEDNSPQRTPQYDRNLALETMLTELNKSMSAISQPPAGPPAYPIVCILGVPRSGTTLLLQWLSSSGAFCYPTNFLSRFANAPVFGAMLQQMLFCREFRFMDEFCDLPLLDQVQFKSDLGKTSGFAAPHEFWYFWRRFFSFPELPCPPEEFLRNADFGGFSDNCAGLQQVFDKPLVLKALIANPYAALIGQRIEETFFVYMHRSPYQNIGSILASRRKYFGTDAEWWSFKPAEFNHLEKLEPVCQVAGQWRFINEMIERQLADIPEHRKLHVDYESFCASPQSIYHQLVEKFDSLNCDLPMGYTGPEQFECSNQIELTKTERRCADAVLSGGVHTRP